MKVNMFDVIIDEVTFYTTPAVDTLDAVGQALG